MSSEFLRPTDGVSIRSPGRRPHGLSAQLFAAALAISLCGCSQPDDPWTRAAASGSVTLDGAPLKEGTITFFPSGATRGPAAGGAIVDGRYDISASEGPIVGTSRVELRSVQKTGRIVKSPVAVESDGLPIDMVEETREVVPPQYNRDSTLEFTIKEGDENVNDIILQSAGAVPPPGQ